MADPFQDGDLAKVQSGQVTPKVVEHDDMFESMDGSQDTSLEAILGGGEGEQAVDLAGTADGEAPAGEEVPGEAETPEEEVPGEVETPEGEVPEGEEPLDPILQDLLDKIDTTTQNVDEASGTLETAIQGGDQVEIKKAYDEFNIALAAKDRQIEILTKQVENEKGQSDRFLNEKFVAESDGREKGKIYDAVMENPVLKDIVVYSMNGVDNPQYAEKLKDATKKLYEETHGVSVDEILNQNRVNEKQGLGESGFASEGTTPDENANSLGGMFETLPG